MLLPYVLYFNGLKYLDPTRAVVTSCLEPVFAILLAVIFVHEAVRGLQIVGIAAVLVATVMVQAGKKIASSGHREIGSSEKPAFEITDLLVSSNPKPRVKGQRLRAKGCTNSQLLYPSSFASSQ